MPIGPAAQDAASTVRAPSAARMRSARAMAWGSEGLPDFADSPISGVFGPFEGRGRHVAVPRPLVLARLDDGLPDIRLQLYRPSNPNSPPAPYGVLDVGLRAVARSTRPCGPPRFARGQPDAALLAGGFARLRPAHAIDGATPEPRRRDPSPGTGSGWRAGPSASRWQTRVLRLRDELRTGVLPAVASATFELEGIAPHIEYRSPLDPGRLFKLLASLGDADGLATRPQLVAFLRPADRVRPMPLRRGRAWECTGTVGDPTIFASAMADSVRARHAGCSPKAEARSMPEPALRLSLAPRRRAPDGSSGNCARRS